MRLIDADELIERLLESRREETETTLKLERFIKKQPTIEPKIGRWVEDAATYYAELNNRGLGVDEYTPYFVDDIACSCCMAKYSVIDNETQFFKFCPNCGARME